MRSLKNILKIHATVLLFMIFLMSCHEKKGFLNSIEMNMVKIPAGTFAMGDSVGQWDEVPVHEVRISRPFYISETEVTAKQFSAFRNDYPFTDQKYATGISWHEANAFCEWLSEKEGKRYRLPTEAEWEYVCRMHDQKVKNLLDTVLEWCYDWYGPYSAVERTTDPVGMKKGKVKVIRGGLPDVFIKKYTYPESFYYRPANRSGIAPSFGGFTVPVHSEIRVASTDGNDVCCHGLTGMIYDDLGMTKPLMIHPLASVNSSSDKWIDMNNWAGKWTGYITAPETGVYTIQARTDGRLTMEIDGRTIIDENDTIRLISSEVRLESGRKYPIVIKYLHDGGDSFLYLTWWQQDGNHEEPIPAEAFSHTEKDRIAIENEYNKGIFARYVRPSIGFRVVQAPMPQSEPLNPVKPFLREGISQIAAEDPPVPGKPWFRKRYLHPMPPDNATKEEIIAAGLAPSLGGHNHSPGFVVCPNGDLLAVYFSATFEDNPEVLLMGSRLRHGADEWDMPEPIIDFPDVNDVSPLVWREADKIYLFWGNIHLRGGYPFQWMESTDNGATFSGVKFPAITKVVDGYAPQPITSMFRDERGTIYLASDGVAAQSFLWASEDDMKTWFDTGGRTGGRHTAIVPLMDGTFFGLGGKKSDIDGFMPISISRDKGKSWEISKSVFPTLGGGQRPALIRLKSGRLLYAGDYQRKDGFQSPGIRKRGTFVALSGDEGKTWHIKKLPGTLESSKEETAREMKGETLGYVCLAQADDGMIHLITSKNAPALHFEFNEAWILSPPAAVSNAGLMAQAALEIKDVQTIMENYPGGALRTVKHGGRGDNGRFLLHESEKWYYENGGKKYEAEYRLGVRVGAERFFLPDGRLLWEREHRGNQIFTWKQYWDNGKIKSETQWVDFRCEGMAMIYDRSGKLTAQFRFSERKDGARGQKKDL